SSGLLTPLAKLLSGRTLIGVHGLKEPAGRQPAEIIGGRVCEKRREADGINMALDNGGALQRDPGDRQGGGKRPQGMAKHRFAMRGTFTEGETHRRGFATAVRPPMSTPISIVVEQLNTLSLPALNACSRCVNVGPSI